MRNIEILEALERGEITAKKAVSMLKSKNKKRIFTKKAAWFKIHVKDDEHNLKFYVPISIVNFGLTIGRLAMKSKFLKYNEGIEAAQNVLDSIDTKDIKLLVKTLKSCGKMNIVEVRDDDTFVCIQLV